MKIQPQNIVKFVELTKDEIYIADDVVLDLSLHLDSKKLAILKFNTSQEIFDVFKIKLFNAGFILRPYMYSDNALIVAKENNVYTKDFSITYTITEKDIT